MWSGEEVMRRWAGVFPPRGPDREPLEVSPACMEQKLADAKFVAQTRQRLADLGRFMEYLQPVVVEGSGQSHQALELFLADHVLDCFSQTTRQVAKPSFENREFARCGPPTGMHSRRFVGTITRDS